MLVINDFLNQDVLQQNCRVGKVYPKNCDPLKLCNPQSDFDMLEICKTCNKKL